MILHIMGLHILSYKQQLSPFCLFYIYFFHVVIKMLHPSAGADNFATAKAVPDNSAPAAEY
jgi:hypothetical protein